MHFTEWLGQQKYRRDLVGELAEQLQKRCWPHTSNLQALRVRLSLVRASSLSHETLELAFGEWDVSKDLPPMTIFQIRSLSLN
jgi:hypothetical protein